MYCAILGMYLKVPLLLLIRLLARNTFDPSLIVGRCNNGYKWRHGDSEKLVLKTVRLYEKRMYRQTWTMVPLGSVVEGCSRFRWRVSSLVIRLGSKVNEARGYSYLSRDTIRPMIIFL